MFSNFIQWLGALGPSEWLGIGGIIIALLFRNRVIDFSRKNGRNESPNVTANGKAKVNQHDK